MYFPSALNTGVSSIPFTWNASPKPSVRKNQIEDALESRRHAGSGTSAIAVRLNAARRVEPEAKDAGADFSEVLAS
jgi:hypothetical protein